MLRAASRAERILSSVERRAKDFADDLEDVPVVRLDRFVQNGVMSREEVGQGAEFPLFNCRTA